MHDRFAIVSEIVNSEISKKYKPGSCDCFITGMKVADAINGTGLSDKYRKVYKTRKQSEKYMKDMGFKSLSDLLSTHFDEIAPASMVWGDIGVVVSNGDEHIAICCGGTFIVRGIKGREVFALSDVVKGFKI